MSHNQSHQNEVLPEGAHRISWGAVFAGLIAVIAFLWLLFLLGSAIGMSVLDATDTAALGEGLGWGAVVWMLLSCLIAYFLGGAMAGRLSGAKSTRGGMLHGVTVWSTAAVLSLLLGAWGIGGTASMVSHATGGVAKAGSRIAVDTRSTMESASQISEWFADSALADEVAAALKTGAADVLARSAEDPEPEEIRPSKRTKSTRSSSGYRASLTSV